MAQGARNSGRVVATTSKGDCAPRSASARMRSSEVGSAQCRSSKARRPAATARPPEPRPSSPPVAGAAIPRAGTSPGGPPAAECRPAARAGARIRPRRGRSDLKVFSRSARRPSSVASAPPKRSLPHSASGWRGVFCRSCEAAHSTQVCGVSASFARNSSIRRDLPMPGSPTIWTN